MSGIVRIGVNASIVGESPTGLGLYSVHLVRELDRLRGDFLVYTSYPQVFGPLRARLTPIPAAVRPGRGLAGHALRILWLQTMLRVRARADRLGLILHTVPEGMVGSGVAQVCVVHDVVPLLYPPDYLRQQYYFRLFVPRVLRAARLVVADSASTRQTLLEHYRLPPERVRVIHPGYDPRTFFSNGCDLLSKEVWEPYLLYVGNLLPHKNVLRLLDALVMIRRRRSCRLVIRGEGRPDYVRAVRERIETLGLGDAVTLIGYTSQQSLRELYARAACLVLPSLAEGFGLPVVEAMACGTPVVTSATSSLPEVAGDAAVMVDPRDTIALAEAMYDVLTDRDLSGDLRRRGFERARLFSWRRTAEQMVCALDEASR